MSILANVLADLAAEVNRPKRIDKDRVLRQKRRERGLCVRCGVSPRNPLSKANCSACLDYERNRYTLKNTTHGRKAIPR
jgi:hypothetical protein